MNASRQHLNTPFSKFKLFSIPLTQKPFEKAKAISIRPFIIAYIPSGYHILSLYKAFQEFIASIQKYLKCTLLTVSVGAVS